MGLGVSVAAASPWAVGLVALYFAAFYPRVMREESDFLRGRFPEEYRQWAAAVPLFLPLPWPAGPRATRFEAKRVGANCEWRSALALLGVAALLGLLSLLRR